MYGTYKLLSADPVDYNLFAGVRYLSLSIDSRPGPAMNFVKGKPGGFTHSVPL